MKFKMDKLNVLDRCINGQIDNMRELLDVAFSHFDVFYNICRDQVGANNIADVEYGGINNRQARFDIICIDKETDSSLLITDGKIMSSTTVVERTPKGISLNISLREE